MTGFLFAKEIVSTYGAVQHAIAVAQRLEDEKHGAIALQLRMTDGWENRNAYRSKYKFWSEFNPDVIIQHHKILVMILNAVFNNAEAHRS
jgi:hypothetical protein